MQFQGRNTSETKHSHPSWEPIYIGLAVSWCVSTQCGTVKCLIILCFMFQFNSVSNSPHSQNSYCLHRLAQAVACHSFLLLDSQVFVHSCRWIDPHWYCLAISSWDLTQNLASCGCNAQLGMAGFCKDRAWCHPHIGWCCHMLSLGSGKGSRQEPT